MTCCEILHLRTNRETLLATASHENKKYKNNVWEYTIFWSLQDQVFKTNVFLFKKYIMYIRVCIYCICINI